MLDVGSIKEGKEATFTILEQNPFKIEPEMLKDIPVWGTVYKGTYWPPGCRQLIES